MLTHNQVPLCSNIWSQYYSSFLLKRFRNEENGRLKLRRPFAGIYVSYCTAFVSHLETSQCAIPVFEGLLPSPHNEQVITLLFRLAEWHALAKLRMHTDTTLSRMEVVTTIIGQQLRKFCSVTCSSFSTRELPKEAAARARRKQHRDATAKVSNVSASDAAGTSIPIPEASAAKPTRDPPPKPKKKKLDLSTYKVHSLGDYPQTIRTYGTTDSYSTQTVSYITIDLQI